MSLTCAMMAKGCAAVFRFHCVEGFLAPHSELGARPASHPVLVFHLGALEVDGAEEQRSTGFRHTFPRALDGSDLSRRVSDGPPPGRHSGSGAGVLQTTHVTIGRSSYYCRAIHALS